ncbi:MAG: hypothetical protein PHS62_04085 [Patescibacteria group bacterium]|nr:hypothetical protein [Patescibacteria group bacterium]
MDNNQNLGQRQAGQDEAKRLDDKLKNYTGPEGITTKELEIGLWYVEHKQLLRRILYGFLMLVGAVSWSYTIYVFTDYLARGMNEDAILTRQMVEVSSIGHDYVLQISAKQLAIAPVGVIKSADKKYDFYAQIKNDNQKWWAEFDYYFVANGVETKKTPGFILPMEDKYLLALAQDFASAPLQVQMIMENISWHRVNQHRISDWDVFYREHLNIASSEIKFTPPSSGLISEKLNLNQLDFKVTNQTAFNYWDVGFTILLYGGGLANVNHYALSDFMSGETRAVSLSWPGDIGRVDKIEIIPEINIMKDDIYIPFEGGVGQEK